MFFKQALQVFLMQEGPHFEMFRPDLTRNTQHRAGRGRADLPLALGCIQDCRLGKLEGQRRSILCPPPPATAGPLSTGLAPVTTMNCWGCILVPVLKKLNELSSLSPKSRFVELSEAYQVLSHEQSRRTYDEQLHSATPPRAPGTTTQPRSAHQAHSSWEPPNARYWAQFHGVRPQGSELRQQQHKHNLRVLGYCLLIMLAGMGLHYVAFRKLEQMHRNFMDEKDRIITAIYNETRARARANRARLKQEQRQSQRPQPSPPPAPGPGIVPPGNSS
ncbi:dnaJ homolog subfamily C member 4 isoform X2 [Talpa occidentalis]|uniref:dnaJ homolog subfamily C member 4 isoform X2 n=1 Tax=Talpa occidentalis TaxID=50954 RepID=UPI0023F63EEE|nr:dnaJ homolog subfamily C member 4 isoform X2 [Talpa occidentalis]